MFDFSQNSLLIISIFYSLGFFVIFLAIMLQRGYTAHFELADSFMFLAGFGLMHGIGDFLVVLPSILGNVRDFEPTIRLISKYFNAVSFMFLYLFGLTVFLERITIKDKIRWGVYMAPIITLVLFIIAVNPFKDVVSSEAVYRLFLGFPSSLLAALALIKTSGRFSELKLSKIVFDFRGAAAGFLFYAIFTGLFFVSYPESSMVLGIPVQLLRALSAMVIAFFTIRFLAVFKV